MRRPQVIIVVAALAAALLAPAGASALTWGACPKGTVPAGVTVRCTTIPVPLDRAVVGGPTVRIRIAEARRRADRRDPSKVLLSLSGGPGQDGWWLAPLELRLGVAPRGWTVVGVDQRGTGISALRCPGLQAQALDDLAVPAPRTLEECAASLGDARAHYRTADTIDDLEDVRSALGIARWGAVRGVSYGSYVASRYARSYPTATARVVLQAIVPAATNVDPFQIRNAESIAVVARSLCGSPCAGQTTRLARVLATPRRVRLGGAQGTRTVDQLSLLDAWVSGSVTGDIFDLPAAQRSALAGDWRPLVRIVDRGTYRGIGVTDYSWALHYSTFCADLPTPWGGAGAPDAGRAEAAAAALAARLGSRTTVGPFLPAVALRQATLAGCRRWPTVAVAAQAVPAPPPGVRALVVHEDDDLSTPAPDAAAELREWGAAGQRLRVRKSGHGWLPDTCPSVVAGFIARGRLSTGACGPTRRYVLPRYVLRFQDVQPMRGGVRGPAARILMAVSDTVWDAVGAGYSGDAYGLRSGTIAGRAGRLLVRGFGYYPFLQITGTLRETYDPAAQGGQLRFSVRVPGRPRAVEGTATLRGAAWTLRFDGGSYTIRFGKRRPAATGADRRIERPAPGMATAAARR